MRKKNVPIQGLWTSKWAFMLATAGAAVGLGNIWKFPYITGENGGGAFVLIYLLCVVFLGIPIMVAEIAVGRHGRGNPAVSFFRVAALSHRSKMWSAVGYLLILAGFLILTYYSVIAGWALDYVFKAASGIFDHASAAKIDGLFENFIHDPEQLILWHTLIMFFTIFVISLGVQKGIEKAIYIMFPGMVILLLILVGYSIDSGFFGQGLAFLFHPNFAKLTPQNILIALGHAFFTLSLATGSIMMYGAYLPKNISVFKSAIFIAVADTLIALFAGLAIFPLVFAHGLNPGEGPDLIFKSLPLAFGHMQYGHFFAVLFFVMLVFAAFTSAISLLEPSVAWVIERFNWNRAQAAILVGFIIWVLGFSTVFSFNIWQNVKIFGLTFFELIDYLTANIMLPAGGLFTTLFVAWAVDKTILHQELPHVNKIIFNAWFYAMKFFVPVAIFLVLLNVLGVI